MSCSGKAPLSTHGASAKKLEPESPSAPSHPSLSPPSSVFFFHRLTHVPRTYPQQVVSRMHAFLQRPDVLAALEEISPDNDHTPRSLSPREKLTATATDNAGEGVENSEATIAVHRRFFFSTIQMLLFRNCSLDG